MTSKTTIDVIENAMWPRSLVGWLAVVLMMMAAYLMLSESYRFFINYFRIYEWENVQGFLIDAEFNENRKKIHLTYSYEINGVKYIGDRIGVTQGKWHDVNNRHIFRFEDIMKHSQPIMIKYNPENKEDSVYAFNSNEIVFVIIMMLLPIALLSMFLSVLIVKIRNFINSPRRLR